MSYFVTPTVQILDITERSGGLFDFNATLPLMAIQFVILSIILTFIFYKPIYKITNEREIYINRNLTQASEKLLKSEELYKQYEDQIKTARIKAQDILAQSEKSVKDVLALEIKEARLKASEEIEQTTKKLEDAKAIALNQLEAQVEELSNLIKTKLIGKDIFI